MLSDESSRQIGQATTVFGKKVAHDMNNYLTVIRSYTDLLLADIPSDSPMRADLSEISQAVEEAVNYNRRIAASSQMFTSDITPVNISHLLTEVASKHDVYVNTPEDLLINTIEPRLSTIIHELLMNAKEATSSADGIRIEARYNKSSKNEECIEIDIIDSGSGIPPAIATSFFHPFITSKAGVRGAGFGLPIARNLVWSISGDIDVFRESDHTIARVRVPSLQ